MMRWDHTHSQSREPWLLLRALPRRRAMCVHEALYHRPLLAWSRVPPQPPTWFDTRRSGLARM